MTITGPSYLPVYAESGEQRHQPPQLGPALVHQGGEEGKEAKEGEAEASTAAREEAEQLLIVKLSSSQRAKLGINYSVFIICI